MTTDSGTNSRKLSTRGSTLKTLDAVGCCCSYTVIPTLLQLIPRSPLKPPPKTTLGIILKHLELKQTFHKRN
jgi:hypothetical protein